MGLRTAELGAVSNGLFPHRVYILDERQQRGEVVGRRKEGEVPVLRGPTHMHQYIAASRCSSDGRAAWYHAGVAELFT